MVIKKGSATAKILAELLVPSYTQKASTTVSFVEFVRDKGIFIRFDEAIEFLTITDGTVDFSGQVIGSYFVTVLNFMLAKNDVELIYSDGKLNVGSFVFDVRDDDQHESVQFQNPHATFTKEQWAKLERDFVATSGTCFKNPRIADVVNFTVHQGTLFKTLPTVCHWEISKFDASVDSVQITQEYGHTTKVWGLPKKVWSLFKDCDEVNVYLADYNKILLKSRDRGVSFNIYQAKYKTFLELYESFSEARKVLKVKDIAANGALLDLLQKSRDYAFEQEEDKNCFLTISAGRIRFEVDGNSYTNFITEYSGNEIKIPVDLVVLAYVLENVNNDTAEIYMDERSIIFVDGDKKIFVANSGML